MITDEDLTAIAAELRQPCYPSDFAALVRTARRLLREVSLERERREAGEALAEAVHRHGGVRASDVDAFVTASREIQYLRQRYVDARRNHEAEASR